MIVGAPGSDTGAGPADVRERRCVECLQRVRAGDSEGLALLYDLTTPVLYPLVLRILGQAGAAEEVLLDVYLEVWRKAESFDRERGSAMSWLVMLARSRAIDRLRSRAGERKREQPLPGKDVLRGIADPEQETLAAERRRIIVEALARLADGQREAIELAFYEGLTHAEIAERLGQPLGTVKTRIRSGMMRLRALLAGLAGATRGVSDDT
ncbi:MAG TPA: sigma-70 family RNA polymerase sigma factor [Bryobacteraceae bacterium]|nr:sigma-70 family RNA polymerase sigma factor [Bryobacteraceae bacterium]